MNDSNNNSENTRSKRTWLFPLGVAAIAISSIVVVSCFHDDDPTTATGSFFDDGGGEPVATEPPPLEVVGSSLFCDTTKVNTGSTVASTLKVEMPDGIQAINISSNEADDSTNNHNAANNLKRLSTTVVAQTPTGAAAVVDDGPDGIPDTGDEVVIGDVHPLIVSYGEQVLCDPAKLPDGQVCNEGGDGSADIADPNHVDDIFTSLSLDNGKSWKKVKVGDTADKDGMPVTWDGQTIIYPGHSHKPTMHVQGNNILVAWNDKHCPSGNPFDLELVDGTYPDDYYKVNGSQGSIDYGLDGSTVVNSDGSTEVLLAPNGKELYEVPFSCVWTARGEFVLDPDPAVQDAAEVPVYTIQWRQAQQLTSGTRDSNKIWIAPAPVGFAITWQEDPEGLRPGKGAGPGVGYSGATTNHGADIWYTYIDINAFDDICAQTTAVDPDCTAVNEDPTPADILALGEKPKSAVKFTYPVRITNNEVCIEGDTKPYCEDPEARNCVSTVAVTSVSGKTTNRCVQDDLDYMVPGSSDATVVPVDAVLDGDTGASRPALTLLATNATSDPLTTEYVAVLAYEETKGLSEQATDVVDVELEGKAVYLETFFWKQPVDISAGRIVNLRVPEATVADDGTYTLTGQYIYENARRVVILPQVDPCEQQGGPTFALLYKQGYDTQGGPSDMFVRVNTGFTFDDFAVLDGREATNVSSHSNTDENGIGAVIWDESWLDTQSYYNAVDNTFSPRGWLRGKDVYTGFEYSPKWKATEVGTIPNNFWIHRYVDGQWYGPVQLSLISNIEGDKISTLDPRFIPTPKGIVTDANLASDQSNPDVIFLGYGTFDMTEGDELDLYYTRSTDKGATWEYLDADGNLIVTGAGLDRLPGTTDDTEPGAKRLAKLAARAKPVHEMELQGLASPDGTMFFGAWLREAPAGDTLKDGLESEFGRVDYDTDKVVVP